MIYQMWEKDGRLQHETSEEVAASIAFARRLWKPGAQHYSTWESAVPVQGAELYDIARRHGMIGEDFHPSDDWDIFDHLPDTSKRTFNRHYAAARRLQMLMALRSGCVGGRTGPHKGHSLNHARETLLMVLIVHITGYSPFPHCFLFFCNPPMPVAFKGAGDTPN
jgi:hypothetical protein